MNNLHHVLEWKSKSDKDMVTVVVKLSSGITQEQVQAYVHNNRQLVLKFTEPDEFASDTLLMLCDTDSHGHIFHKEESTICAAMKDSCFKI